MKHIRNFSTLVVVGFALVTMVGCSLDGTADGTEARTAVTQEVHGTNTSILEVSTHTGTPELPAEYQITYEMENGDSTISLITMAKDSKGDLYYRDGTKEIWFLSQGNGYVQASPNEDGALIPTSSGTILKEKAVRENTAAFWECVETSDKLLAPGFSHAGIAMVAERTCDLYTNTFGITGLNVTYQLYIDQKTGVCLGWTEEKETGIFDSEVSEGIFLCSEFLTEDIVLPNSAK